MISLMSVWQFCIGPVLRTIQTIGKSRPLKPVSLRLMCKLWEKQNRVFPHLQRLLNVNDTQLGIEMDLEIQISKAACVLDICRTRYGHCVNMIVAKIRWVVLFNLKINSVLHQGLSLYSSVTKVF